MKRNFFSKVFQASLLCCLAVFFVGCEELGMESNPTPSYISLNTSDVTLKVGGTFVRKAIVAGTAVVIYSSSNEAVATVDQTGKITAVGEGTATITALVTGYDAAGKKIYTPEEKSYKVTVVPATVPVTSITLNETNLNKKVGDAAVTLTATVAPDDATDKTVTWESSNTSVATVADGVVTFVGAGTATITATATNGTADTADDKSATCAVTVTIPLPSITYITYTWNSGTSTLSGNTANTTDYTKVTSSTVTWSDGTYVVDDNVTITGNITVSGNVNLILCDGKTLTVNGRISYASGYGSGNLSIYAQSVAPTAGSFVVTCNNGNAIDALNTLKIYGGDILASSSTTECGGIVNTQIDVYGGKLTTKKDGISNGCGIWSNANKSINLYGGELIAEGNGTFNDYAYGITLKHASSCLTVYPGAKLKASNPTGGGSRYAIRGKIKSGTDAVKFYFADTEAGLGSVSGNTYDGTTAAPTNQFAKAE